MTELQRWTTPRDYYGYDPVDDFVIAVKTRDSSLLTISNFSCIKERLLNAAKEAQEPETRYDRYGDEMSSDYVYTWSASCWVHGWREYLMVRGDAPKAIVDIAKACTEALEVYPIFDEDDYQQRQDAAVEDYWSSCSLKERMHYCKKAHESIFAARHDYPGPEVYDYFMNSGEFS